MTKVNEARNIFKVLDAENNGFITVKKFISAFNDFYKNTKNENKEENSIKSLIEQMHPDVEGRIYFYNFNAVFQHMTSEINMDSKGRRHEKYSIRRFLSAEVNDSSDEEASEIGNQFHSSNEFNGIKEAMSTRALVTPSAQSEYMVPKLSQNSEFTKSANHSTWPLRRLSLNVSTSLLPSAASRARELLSAGASPRDSEAHSEILCHEIGNNFDYLQVQMKRLEEKIESFHSNQNDVDGKQSKRLKEENSVLTRRINNLEDNLRELEERSENRISEEKKDIKLRITRSEDDKKLELDLLYNRVFKLEAESADLSLEIRQYRDESAKLKAEKHSLTEMLAESDTKLNSLQDNFENIRKQSKLDVEILKKERDQYEKLILELQDKKNIISSDSSNREIVEISGRHKELEDLVDKLKEENRELSCQLEDTHKDLVQRAAREGEDLLKMNDELYIELEPLSKEQLMDYLVKEKDANRKLKEYIEKIIVKVMEMHPSLLEVADTSR